MGFTGLFGTKAKDNTATTEIATAKASSTTGTASTTTSVATNAGISFGSILFSALGPVASAVSDILTSDDKIEIAKYEAQGEIAKANAIIAEAQAKANAQAEAEKAKSQTTIYIIIGVVVFLLIIVLIVVMSRKPTQAYYPQYQIKKPIMPTNYVPSAPPPRQLQPVAPKA